MERAKKLIEEIRENFRLASTKIEALKDEGVILSVEVGSNEKTVNFKEVEILEFTVKATVNQEL